MLGVEVSCLGFKVFDVWISGGGSRSSGSGFQVLGFGLKVSSFEGKFCFGFWVLGFGFRIWSLGLRVN